MRIFKIATLAAAATMIAAAPASAQSNSSNDSADAGETNAANRIVCRRFPPPTGTRIGPRRVCKTQHEWDIIDQETRDVMENVGNRSRVGNE